MENYFNIYLIIFAIFCSLSRRKDAKETTVELHEKETASINLIRNALSPISFQILMQELPLVTKVK